MEYPARFTPDKTAGGFVVTFPDVPEAITQGDTIEEAMAMASEALELALTFYTAHRPQRADAKWLKQPCAAERSVSVVRCFRRKKWADLPVPGSLKRGMRMVRVPALSEAKFRLHSALRAAGVRKIDLARRLKCSPSQVDRLLDISHHPRLRSNGNARSNQMEAAFAAIGKRLSIEIRDAA